jgi:hypothetical protein
MMINQFLDNDDNNNYFCDKWKLQKYDLKSIGLNLSAPDFIPHQLKPDRKWKLFAEWMLKYYQRNVFSFSCKDWDASSQIKPDFYPKSHMQNIIWFLLGPE